MTDEIHHPVRARVLQFLAEHEEDIRREWVATPLFGTRDRVDSREEVSALLSGVREVIRTEAEEDPGADGFAEVSTVLGSLAARSAGGPSGSKRPDVTVLKKPLLRLWEQQEVPGNDAYYGALILSAALNTLRITLLEIELSAGADTILAQQEQLAELSTPVVKLWDGILAIPLIGTLDSMRSQAATESLLEQIVKQQARVAILDITGVTAVDTLVAQHLLKTAMAARLMGAECIISGIRPQIAQTMVQLGIDLGEVATRATLADAFAYALRTSGFLLARTDEMK
ncbi:STAS domain-containing protein [Saccharomonospora glauca]|uniref:Anti-anti-sigma regulatory factor (Antagonist of anti-sigma factor) n=1 Tax=Saccharomonospora glauca K62 TaxID=928724 RepID=I1D656_9PSEU|nr:STAS domain-containing protein [Saccharomonospora glauca]EIF00431.1 anti-anti-sigma regulatory factor (antagonist of anti-sigma factor) [Saccharomonospora glauca K62]